MKKMLGALGDAPYSEMAKASRIISGETEPGDLPTTKVYTLVDADDTDDLSDPAPSAVLNVTECYYAPPANRDIIGPTGNVSVRLLIEPTADTLTELEGDESLCCDLAGNVLLGSPDYEDKVNLAKVYIIRVDDSGNTLVFPLVDDPTNDPWLTAGNYGCGSVNAKHSFIARLMLLELNATASVVIAKHVDINVEHLAVEPVATLTASLLTANSISVTFDRHYTFTKNEEDK